MGIDQLSELGLSMKSNSILMDDLSFMSCDEDLVCGGVTGSRIENQLI